MTRTRSGEQAQVQKECGFSIETGEGAGDDTSTRIRGGIGVGVIQTLGVLLAFVGFGMGWAQLETRGLAVHPTAPTYPGNVPEGSDPSDAPSDGVAPGVWLVDGFNVLHASLLGGRDREEWWNEARRDEVLTLARSLERSGGEVWVVFDGPWPGPAEGRESSTVRQVFAPSADEWLLRRVRESAVPSQIAVVTADRRLASRIRHRGALVVSPGEFVARCRAESGEEEQQT
jgi:predicted RNA-binding protein with PIN domain